MTSVGCRVFAAITRSAAGALAAKTRRPKEGAVAATVTVAVAAAVTATAAATVTVAVAGHRKLSPRPKPAPMPVCAIYPPGVLPKIWILLIT